MERLKEADLKEGLIRIHCDGVSFYRTAYERNKTPENKEKLFKVMLAAMEEIEALVNGKAKG